jgi:predicted O-methyltransferase YrrM
MPIIGKLVEMYRAQGIDICTGLRSYDFYDLPTAPFTRFIENGRSITNDLGIAMQEIYLLENVFAVYRPRHALIIGNSLGWSALAIGLLLPDSRVVAMDAGFDENSLHGLALTNRMADLAGLNKLRAVKGVSPGDVAAVVDAGLDGRVDFAFIDATHTNEQIVLDFEAASRKAAEDAVYLFHDVHLFGLYDGIKRIESLAGRAVQSLRATPSGMVLLYDPRQHPGLTEAIAAFAPAPEARALVKSEARQYGIYRHLKRRLKRNPVFMTGANVLCRLVGAKPYSLPQDP